MPEEPKSSSSSVWASHTYQKDLPDDIETFRRLLESYSHVPPSEVEEHLHTIRDKAWAVARFPCVGKWSFMDLSCMEDPIFETVAARLKKPDSSDSFLDVACGLGQVVRKLAADGVDQTRLYGTDILSTFLDISFDLFRDRDRFPPDHLITADLLQAELGPLAPLEGKISLAHASNFFHLFSWDQQVQVASNLVKLLQPDAEGAMIFGRQVGRLNAGEMQSWASWGAGQNRFLHDLNSLQKLWDEIGSKTGTKWEVEARLLGRLPFKIPGYPEDTQYLSFTARRL